MIALPTEPRVHVSSQALRDLVASALPSHLRLDSIEVTFGTLFPGQPPRAKLIVHVEEVGRGGGGAPWLYRLSQRISVFWSRDEVYVEVRGRPAAAS